MNDVGKFLLTIGAIWLVAFIGPPIGLIDEVSAEHLLVLGGGIFIGGGMAEYLAAEKDGSNEVHRKILKLQKLMAKMEKENRE